MATDQEIHTAIRAACTKTLEQLVDATKNDLDFSPPELEKMRLAQLATKACQAGVDMTLALIRAGVKVDG
jgi:hypothetical protein